jgi:hypothetical protein
MKKIRGNVRAVTTDWKTYERVWAENGVVNIESKDGQISRIDPRTAALRAQAINRMMGAHNIPWAQRERAVNFVSKIIEVIKEARSQIESPSTTKEQLVANVLAGKTAEGKEIKPITDPEEMLQYLCFKYPMMARDEIKEVVTQTKIPQPQKIMILQTINSDRMYALIEENKKQQEDQK